jgi:signal transduction histidine kinase
MSAAPAPARNDWGGLRAVLATRPLAAKLALLCAAVTVLVVGGALLLLRSAAVRDVRRVLVGELGESQKAWQSLQEQRLHLLLATSTLVSTSPTLRAALETGRGEANLGFAPRRELLTTIQREVERILGELDRDLLVVTDSTGKVLAAASREGLRWSVSEVAHLPAVRHALAAELPVADSSFGLIQMDGQTVQVGCAAIVLQGYPIGVLLLGDRLVRVIPQVDSSVPSALVVTAGDTVLRASSGIAIADLKRAGLLAPRPTAEPSSIRLGEDEYLEVTLPLGLAEAGRPAAVHLLRSVSASLRPLDRTLTRSFLAVGLIAMLLAGLGAALVSRSMLAPFGRFVAFLRGGTEGQRLTPFTDPKAGVELRTLIDVHNELLESLARQHRELEHRAETIARANQELRDEIRERERAEAALRESEAQLRQAQKLEALGRLASGVSHDFNNLLMVIATATHFLRTALSEGSPEMEDVGQIEAAAERAKTLVRQLLAFSRKQVLEPRIVSLNQVIAGLEPLLGRLVGAGIRMQVTPGPDLAAVRADPGQLEQVLMNLVVNACDAMPEGGTLRIETRNVTLDNAYATRPEAISGGPAVMLAVADNGIGMDAEIRTRIFEPFYTTKPPGKGTGLGLSTVYGIVRQSGGSITVFSEPGQGSTFRIYFPVAQAEAQAPEPATEGTAPLRGTETLLWAEDDDAVRELIGRFLESCGYRVLEAETGHRAIQVAAGHDGPIHVLVTDVMMPEVSGLELARRLHAERPELRVILLSGDAVDDKLASGELDQWVRLQKPVEPALIARTVRELLDVGLDAVPGR